MPNVFGPVPSRRLGLSLGVDLIPCKTCTYNCLYCQVGETSFLKVRPEKFVSERVIINEISEKLLNSTPDAITFAGSGEPTLNSEIGKIITSVKELSNIKVVVLTNGSLFWQEEVRKRVLMADVIMPTLVSAFEDTFKCIHRPHPSLKLINIIEGLRKLRGDYQGSLDLEVIFLEGLNDSEKEIIGLKMIIDQIEPDKIQINTVVRPPTNSKARPVPDKRLAEIMTYFGKKAEIITSSTLIGKERKEDLVINNLLEMVRRRPLRAVDIAASLNLSLKDVDGLVKGLLVKGYLRKQKHSEKDYFISNEKDTPIYK